MGCARKLLLASAACAAISALCAPRAGADILLSYEKIALEGEVAPGLTTQAFTLFHAPVINSAGQVAFYGEFLDGALTQSGLWSTVSVSGDLELAVRTAVNAPDTTENLFTFVGAINNRVAIGGGGNLAFHGALGNPPSGPADRGIWYGAPGALTLLAREGDEAPDAGGALFINNLGTFGVGPGGVPAFSSIVTGGTEHNMFFKPAAALDSLYLAGAQVPGEAPGVLYQGPNTPPTPPQTDALGRAAFLGSLTGNATGAAVFLGPANDVRVAAAVGRDAPGFSTSVDFESFSRPDLNELGEVAFAAGLSGFGNETAGVGDAIFYGSISGILPAVQVGDAVGVLPGVTYASFPTSLGPTTNDLGQVAFLATITGTGIVSTTDTVIMAGQAGDPEDLSIIGQEGLDLPEDFTLLTAPLINNQGLIAFATTSLEDGTELWLAELATSELVRVIGTGDDAAIVGVLPPNENDPPIVITGLTLGSTTDGFRFLSEEGTLAFRLTFDNSSEGVFIVNSVIPEPAAGALLGLGMLALLARRRRA